MLTSVSMVSTMLMYKWETARGYLQCIKCPVEWSQCIWEMYMYTYSNSVYEYYLSSGAQ